MKANKLPLALRRHQLVAHVRTCFQEKDVLIGVSGGADSIALLHLAVAAAAQKSSSFRIVAGHIHHGLRADSDNEQFLVEALCAKLGVKCITAKINIAPINGSIAYGAREARYEALYEMAITEKINTVAVAHHADDQLETMIMALCRGGGLQKLSGMEQLRPMHDVNLLRPLLQIEKKDLIEICDIAQAKWCEDPTNIDASTPRGKLRKEVIPILREMWPAAGRHAANASVLLHAATDAFESLVPYGDSWLRKTLATLPAPIIAEAIHGAIGTRATHEQVAMIASAIADKSTEPRRFHCEGNCIIKVTAHKVEVHYK